MNDRNEYCVKKVEIEFIINKKGNAPIIIISIPMSFCFMILFPSLLYVLVSLVFIFMFH